MVKEVCIIEPTVFKNARKIYQRFVVIETCFDCNVSIEDFSREHLVAACSFNHAFPSICWSRNHESKVKFPLLGNAMWLGCEHIDLVMYCQLQKNRNQYPMSDFKIYEQQLLIARNRPRQIQSFSIIYCEGFHVKSANPVSTILNLSKLSYSMLLLQRERAQLSFTFFSHL